MSKVTLHGRHLWVWGEDERKVNCKAAIVHGCTRCKAPACVGNLAA